MTKNVFTALNFINCEGLDNSQWGLETDKHEMSLAEMFPVNKEIWGSVSCPQSFLWVWVEPEEIAGRLLRLKLQPNYIIFTDTGEMVFIWELRAED